MGLRLEQFRGEYISSRRRLRLMYCHAADWNRACIGAIPLRVARTLLNLPEGDTMNIQPMLEELALDFAAVAILYEMEI